MQVILTAPPAARRAPARRPALALSSLQLARIAPANLLLNHYVFYRGWGAWGRHSQLNIEEGHEVSVLDEDADAIGC